MLTRTSPSRTRSLAAGRRSHGAGSSVRRLGALRRSRPHADRVGRGRRRGRRGGLADDPGLPSARRSAGAAAVGWAPGSVAAAREWARAWAAVESGPAVGGRRRRNGVGDWSRNRGRWGRSRRCAGDGPARVVVGEQDLGRGPARQAAGLGAPLVHPPAVGIRPARLVRRSRVVVGRGDRPVLQGAGGPGGVHRRGGAGPGRLGRVVDLVPGVVVDVEALARGVRQPAPVEDVVPGVHLHRDRARAQRLGRPRADPLPRQDVPGVDAEIHGLDRAGGDAEDADGGWRRRLTGPAAAGRGARREGTPGKPAAKQGDHGQQ